MENPSPGRGEGPTVSGAFSGNSLRSRADLQRVVSALWRPVAARLSRGGARARLGHTGAVFPDVAAELEGFARPLWGLAPLAAGGGAVDWEPHRRGLASGSDPGHPEYWGDAGGHKDQRLVEMAPIAFALALVPEQLWEPLDRTSRRNLARWLGQINRVALPDNNWLFFRVIVNEALARLGAEQADEAAQAAALDRLESFYLGEGWYSDGPTPRRDYYVAFSLHFYGLLYAALAGARDPARAGRFRERAALFARDFARWFADDGAALPFGRSLTYRFAQGAFWGALAFAGVEALPWGEVKGLALRHLRWWAGRPIADNGGVLAIGYAYPNLMMSEEYNSPGSPYWAMKFFLPLALPDSHPFWTCVEARTAPPAQPVLMRHAGMIVCRDGASGQVFALTGGQQEPRIRHGAQRYAKFAYSTAFGFSVPAGDQGLEQGAHDSALALSDDNGHWRVRETCEETGATPEALYARWRPWPDVVVETWLLPRPPWHLRVHRLRAARPLWSAEGGFALDQSGATALGPGGGIGRGAAFAVVANAAGLSVVRDLAGQRQGTVVRTSPNTNLLFARAAIPTLLDTHPPGEHWLLCAVLATTNLEEGARAWQHPPGSEDLGRVVPGWPPPRDVLP